MPENKESLQDIWKEVDDNKRKTSLSDIRQRTYQKLEESYNVPDYVEGLTSFGIESVDELKAQRQSNWDKAANSVGRFAGRAITSGLEIGGNIYGLGKLGIELALDPINRSNYLQEHGSLVGYKEPTWATIFDNEVTRTLDNADKLVKSWLPEYESKDYKNASWYEKLGYANFYFDQLADAAGFAAGSVGGATMYSKLTNNMFKLAKAGAVDELNSFMQEAKSLSDAGKDVVEVSKKIDKAASKIRIVDNVDKAITMTVSGTSESGQEARGTGDDLEYKLTHDDFGNPLDLTDDQLNRIKQLKDKAEKTSFWMNLAVTGPTSMIVNNAAIKKLRGLKDVAEEAKLVKPKLAYSALGEYTVEKGSKLGQFAISTGKAFKNNSIEALQEMYQTGAQKGITDFYKAKYEGKDDFDQLLKSTTVGINEAFSDEGMLSGLLGFLTPGVSNTILTGGGNIKEALGQFSKQQKSNLAYSALLNKNSTNKAFKEMYDSATRHQAFSNQLDEAIANSDDFEAKNQMHNIMTNLVLSRINTGRFEDLKSDLDYFKTLTPEKFEETFGVKLDETKRDTVASFIESKIEQADEIKKTSDNVNTVFGDTLSLPNKARLIHATIAIKDAKQRSENLTKEVNDAIRKNYINSTTPTFQSDLIILNQQYNKLTPEQKVEYRDVLLNSEITPLDKKILIDYINDIDKLAGRNKAYVNLYNELVDPQVQKQNDDADQQDETNADLKTAFPPEAKTYDEQLAEKNDLLAKISQSDDHVEIQDLTDQLLKNPLVKKDDIDNITNRFNAVKGVSIRRRQLTGQLERAKAKRDNVLSQLSITNKSIEDRAKEVNDIVDDLYEKDANGVLKLKDETRSKKAQNQLYKLIDEAQNDINNFRNQIDELNKELNTINEEIKDIEDKVASGQPIEQVRETLTERQNTLNKLVNEINDANENLTALQKILRQLQRVFRTLFPSAKTELETGNVEVIAANEELTSKKEAIKELKDLLKAYDKLKTKITNDISKLSDEINEFENQLSSTELITDVIEKEEDDNDIEVTNTPLTKDQFDPPKKDITYALFTTGGNNMVGTTNVFTKDEDQLRWFRYVDKLSISSQTDNKLLAITKNNNPFGNRIKFKEETDDDTILMVLHTNGKPVEVDGQLVYTTMRLPVTLKEAKSKFSNKHKLSDAEINLLIKSLTDLREQIKTSKEPVFVKVTGKSRGVQIEANIKTINGKVLRRFPVYNRIIKKLDDLHMFVAKTKSATFGSQIFDLTPGMVYAFYQQQLVPLKVAKLGEIDGGVDKAVELIKKLMEINSPNYEGKEIFKDVYDKLNLLILFGNIKSKEGSDESKYKIFVTKDGRIYYNEKYHNTLNEEDLKKFLADKFIRVDGKLLDKNVSVVNPITNKKSTYKYYLLNNKNKSDDQILVGTSIESPDKQQFKNVGLKFDIISDAEESKPKPVKTTVTKVGKIEFEDIGQGTSLSEALRNKTTSTTAPVASIAKTTAPVSNITVEQWDEYYGTKNGKYPDGKMLASYFYNPLWASIDAIKVKILNLPDQFIKVSQGKESLKKYGFTDSQIENLEKLDGSTLVQKLETLKKRVSGMESTDAEQNKLADEIINEFKGREVNIFNSVTGLNYGKSVSDIEAKTQIEGLNERLDSYGNAKVILPSDFYEGERPKGRLNAFKSSISKVADNLIVLADLNLNEFDFLSKEDKQRLDTLRPLAQELNKINVNDISLDGRRTIAVEKRFAQLTNQLANEFVDIVGKHVEQQLGKTISSSKPKLAALEEAKPTETKLVLNQDVNDFAELQEPTAKAQPEKEISKDDEDAFENALQKVSDKKISDNERLDRFREFLPEETPATKEQLDAEEKWFKKNFPQIDYERLRTLIDNKGVGKFLAKGKVLISDLAVEGTTYHEAWHVVSQLFLTEEELNNLYKDYKNRTGFKGTNRELEELLAEDFRNYMLGERTTFTPKTKSIFQKIVDFFKSLFSLNNSTLEDVFLNIKQGKYKSSKIIRNSKQDLYRTLPGKTVEFTKDLLDSVNVFFFRNLLKINDASSIESIFELKDINDLYDKVLDDFLRTYKIYPEELQNRLKPNYVYLHANWNKIVEEHIKSLQKYGVKIKLKKSKENVNDDSNENNSPDADTTQEKVNYEDKVQELERTTKDNTYIDTITFSAKDGMPKAIKLLIASLPEGRMVDGEFKININTTFGTPKLSNYNKTIDFLHNKLASAQSIKEMVARMTLLLPVKPELFRLMQYLKTSPGNTTPVTLSLLQFLLQMKFFQQFAKTKNTYLTMMLDEEGNIYSFDSNSSRLGERIKTQWKNNKKNDINKGDGFYVLRQDKVIAIDKNRVKGILSKYPLSNIENTLLFLSKFGIKFSTNKFTEEEETLLRKAALKIVEFAVDKDVIDIFQKDVVGETISDLVNIEANYTTSETELQHVNPEGKTVYGITLNTYLSLLVNDINNTYSFNYMDEEKNPYAKSSLWKDAILKGQQIKLEVAEGLKSSLPGEDGVITSDLDMASYILQQINLTLNDRFPFLRAGDKKLEYVFNMPTSLNKEEFIDQMLLYYKDDVMRSLALKNGAGDNIEFYKDNALKSLIFEGITDIYPDLNKINKLKNKDKAVDKFIEENKTRLTEAIDVYLAKQVEEFKKVANRYNIIEPKDNVIKVNGINKATVQKIVGKEDNITIQELNRLAEQFIIKSFVGNVEQTKLFTGDLAFYNVVKGDFNKRTGGLTGPKKVANVDPETNEWLAVNAPRKDGKIPNGKINTIVYDDVKSKSEYFELYKTLIGKEKADEAYNNIKEADAQGYITLDEYREFFLRSGEWTTNHDKAYKKAIKGETLTAEDFQYFMPLKPQYFGPQYDANGLYVPTYYKFSLMPLIPSMIKGRNLEKLNEQMIKNKVGIAMMASANKVGARMQNGKLVNFYTPEGTINENTNIQEIDYKYLGIQLDIAPIDKRKVTFGTQFRKLIMSNLFSSAKPKVINILRNGKLVKTDGAEIKKEYDDVTNKLTSIRRAKLIEKLNISPRQDGSYRIADVEQFKKVILEEAESRDVADNILKSIELALDHDNKFLDATVSKNKIEQILFSLVNNNIISQKVFGDMKVMGSAAGFEIDARKFKTLTAEEKGGIEWISNTQTLKFYHKDAETGATTKMQVLLPSWFKEIIGDVSTINDKRLLELIGYRIPTQGLNSIDSIEVVGFLPKEAGNLIITPSEIVGKAGSDYDVDKLSVFLPNYIMVNNKPEYLPTTEEEQKKLYNSIKESDKRYTKTFNEFKAENEEAILQNKLINIAKEVLSSPEMLDQLILPNSVSTLKGLVKKIREIEEKNEIKGGKRKITGTKLLQWYDNAKTAISFWSGKAGVGVAALHNTSHILAQQAGLYITSNAKTTINLKHNITENNDIDLGGEFDVTGKKRISDIINEFVNAYVDIAKDPFVFDLNAGIQTANTWLYLVRAGVPVETIGYFMRQPIIWNYVTAQSINESLLNKTLGKEKGKEKLIIEIKKQYKLDKFKKDEVFKFDESKLESYLSKANQTSDEFFKAQQAILDDFIEYQAMGRALGELMKTTNTDTKGVGKNRSSVRNSVDALDELIQSKIFGNFNKYIDDSVLKQFISVLRESANYYNDLFISDNEKVKETVNVLKDSFKKRLSGDNLDKVTDLIENELITYLIHTQPKNENALINKIDELFKGPNSLAIRLLKAKEDPKLSKNYFIENLFPLVSNNRNKIDNIKLFSKRMSVYETNQLTESYNQLYEVNPGLADDITKLGILQSGLTNSPISFLSIIPAEKYFDIASKAIDFVNISENANIEDFTDLFYQNNYRNKDVVRTIPNWKFINASVRVTPNGKLIFKDAGDFYSEDAYIKTVSVDKSIPKKEREEMKSKGEDIYITRLYKKVTDKEFVEVPTKGEGIYLKDYRKTDNVVEKPKVFEENKPTQFSTNISAKKALNIIFETDTFTEESVIPKKQKAIEWEEYKPTVKTTPLGNITLNIIEDWVQSGQATTTVRNNNYHNSFYKGDGVYTTDKGNLVNITYKGLVKLQGNKVVGNNISYTKDEFAKAEGFGTWANFEKGAKYAGKTLMDGGSVHLYNISPFKPTTTTPTVGAVKPTVEITKSNYTRKQVQDDPNTAYVFTENTHSITAFPNRQGGGSAIIRPEPNAFAIVTKKKYDYNTKENVDYPDTEADFKEFVDVNTKLINDLKNSGKSKIVFPQGFATDKAKMPTRFAEWLQKALLDNFGLVTELNTTKTGLISKSIQVTTQPTVQGGKIKITEEQLLNINLNVAAAGYTDRYTMEKFNSLSAKDQKKLLDYIKNCQI